VSCTAPPTLSELAGNGAIGTGSPTPGSDYQTFTFDVKSDNTGTLKFTDYGTVRSDGSVGTLTVDPATDPATGITAFRTSSPACAAGVPGAEFDGMGREDAAGGGGLLSFTVIGCDDDATTSGAKDGFSLAVPSESYGKSGKLVSGDIVRSGP